MGSYLKLQIMNRLQNKFCKTMEGLKLQNKCYKTMEDLKLQKNENMNTTSSIVRCVLLVNSLLSIYKFGLSVCFFVSNKRQNG